MDLYLEDGMYVVDSVSEIEDIARASFDECNSLTSYNLPVVFGHWSAGSYAKAFHDYHVCVMGDGRLVLTCESLAERKVHTWRRNSGNVAVGMMCCVGATSNGLGSCPPTPAQVENFCRVVAAIFKGFGYSNCTSDNFRTHGEQAYIDGYGLGSGDSQTRWDLSFLADGDALDSGGDILRGKINYYLTNDDNELSRNYL